MNANRIGGWMVPFHMSWRTQGGGTKVWLGFSTMWDGIPPCVTIVGDTDDGGKGTKVCRLRDLMLSRRRF